MMLPPMPLTQPLIDSALNTLLLDSRPLIGKRSPTIHGAITLIITDHLGTLTDLVLNLTLVSPESTVTMENITLVEKNHYSNLFFNDKSKLLKFIFLFF